MSTIDVTEDLSFLDQDKDGCVCANCTGGMVILYKNHGIYEHNIDMNKRVSEILHEGFSYLVTTGSNLLVLKP